MAVASRAPNKKNVLVTAPWQNFRSRKTLLKNSDCSGFATGQFQTRRKLFRAEENDSVAVIWLPAFAVSKFSNWVEYPVSARRYAEIRTQAYVSSDFRSDTKRLKNVKRCRRSPARCRRQLLVCGETFRKTRRSPNNLGSNMSEEQTDVEPEKKSGSMMKMVIWLVVVMVSIGGGFATPLIVTKFTAAAEQPEEPEMNAPDPDEEVEFIEFDEVVAVLGNSRFSRYLKMNFSLQVAKSQRLEIEEKIAARNAVLKNRIISHVAEISAEDLEGQFGHNRLRRDMHNYFNEILFDDGIERIQDVLFRELQVQ